MLLIFSALEALPTCRRNHRLVTNVFHARSLSAFVTLSKGSRQERIAFG